VDDMRPSAACDVSFRSGVGFDEHPLCRDAESRHPLSGCLDFGSDATARQLRRRRVPPPARRGQARRSGITWPGEGIMMSPRTRSSPPPTKIDLDAEDRTGLLLLGQYIRN